MLSSPRFPVFIKLPCSLSYFNGRNRALSDSPLGSETIFLKKLSCDLVEGCSWLRFWFSLWLPGPQAEVQGSGKEGREREEMKGKAKEEEGKRNGRRKGEEGKNKGEREEEREQQENKKEDKREEPRKRKGRGNGWERKREGKGKDEERTSEETRKKGKEKEK